jgi:D-amino-acid dehydrogenase
VSDPDVLVVGGGVAGLFCAHFLRRAGDTVAVVERGAFGGPQSCSSGNTGFVGTHGAAPLASPGLLRALLRPDGPLHVRPRWDRELLRWLRQFRAAGGGSVHPALLEMKRRSFEILRKLCASGGLADTFAAPGMIVAYRSPREFEWARRAAVSLTGQGLPLRVLDPGEVAALEPDVEFDIHGAIYNEEGAYLRVPAFVTELARTLRDAGVSLHPDTEVTGVDVTGREVRRVHTNRGSFRPGRVVLAAGAWSSGLVPGLGLLVQPLKGYAVSVAAVSPSVTLQRPVTLGEVQAALAPVAGGLRLGGTRQLAGMSHTVAPARVAAMLRTAGRYLPGLRGASPSQVWTGLRPSAPDSLPFIGRAGRYDNVFVACGHGHIGMGLAPAGGELLAQLMAGAPPDLDPAPFRVDRYSADSADSADSTEDSHGA